MQPPPETPRYGPRFFSTLRIFGTTKPTRQITVLVCLFGATLAEGFGIASILPMFSIAQGNADNDSTLNQVFKQIVEYFGLPFELRVVACMLVVGFVLKGILYLFAMNHVGITVAKVTTSLRLKLIGRLLEAKWIYFTRQPVGRFGNAISGEATRAGEAYLSVAILIAVQLQVLMYLFLAYLIAWELAAAALAFGIFLTILLSWIIRRTRRAGRVQTARTRSLTAGLTDALIGLKPLKAMARHLRFAVLFERDAKELKQALMRQVFARNTLRVTQELIIVSIIAIGFPVAIVVFHYPFEEILVVTLLLIKLAMTLAQGQRQMQTVQQTESAFWSLQETINEAEAAKEAFTGTRVPTLDSGIEFRDVSFAYDRKAVLDDVSLFVPAGKVTTITGTSGAGKTTTADLVLGLYLPKEGAVLIDNVPLPEIDLLKWREMTGYVPQEVILFHDSIYANIALGDPQFDHASVRAALEAAGAWDFVEQLPEGMDSVVGERGALLSGGQRQRIAVARAIVHRPKLVILDEATSALDPETELAICNNLKDLSRRTGLTVLAITHQPAWVEAADRIYRVSDGTIVEQNEASRHAAPKAKAVTS